MQIKTIAGKMLLVFYALQRENPISLQDEIVSIVTHSSDKDQKIPKFDSEKSDLIDKMHRITTSDSDLYSAFHFLLDKGFITFTNQNSHKTMGGENYFGLRLTDLGFDVVEGVEQNKENQKKFFALFNIKANMTIDSLVKAEVGNIVGIGGAVNI